jgi:hypothetical protein
MCSIVSQLQRTFVNKRRGVTCLNCNIASQEDRVAWLEVLCLVFGPKSQSSNAFLCVESCRFAFWQTECISYGRDTRTNWASRVRRSSG